MAAVTAVLRAPSFVYPIMDIDEGSYAAIACRMLTGGLPYRDGVENKFPAIFYLYTAVFGLFGRYDMRAMHAVAALAALGTALAAGAIAATLARRRGADPLAARRARWLAAMLYAVFSTTYEPKLLAANTELFAVLPASLAVLVYLRARGRPSAFVAAGALAACALLFKQVAGLLLVALAADRLIRGSLFRREPRRSSRRLVLLGLGVVGVAGTVAVLFWRRGILGDAVFWSWTYIFHHYMPAAPGRRAIASVARLFKCFLPFALAMLAAAVSRPSGQVAGRGPRRVALWLVSMTGAGLIGGRMYGHYFLPHGPSPRGPGRRRRGRVADGRVGRRATPAGGAHVAAMASSLPGGRLAVPGATDSWLALSPDYRRAAAYVRAWRTQPDDRLFVWGWFPALYVDADRCPASRFVYTHLLSGARSQSGATTRGHLVPEAPGRCCSRISASTRPAYILGHTSPGRYDYPFPPSSIRRWPSCSPRLITSRPRSRASACSGAKRSTSAARRGCARPARRCAPGSGDDLHLDDLAVGDDGSRTRRAGRPGAQTAPAAPSTSACCAPRARPRKVSATAVAPRNFGRKRGRRSTDSPPPRRLATLSGVEHDLSGSSTASSAWKSPSREAVRKAPTSFCWWLTSASEAVRPSWTRRRARLRQLPGRHRRPPHDGRDVVEVGEVEHAVQHERHPLGRRQRLQHHQQGHADRVWRAAPALGLRSLVGVRGRIGRVALGRLLVPGLARAQHVQADARHTTRRQPAAEVVDRAAVRPAGAATRPHS